MNILLEVLEEINNECTYLKNSYSAISSPRFALYIVRQFLLYHGYQRDRTKKAPVPIPG